MSNIKLYDTVKDKKGNRFRVTEVKADEGKLVATLRMLDKGGLQKKGRPRKVDMKTLEADYTRVNLPEVTVRKIDDLSEEESEMVKVFGKKDKDAQNENQSLTGLSDEEVEEALIKSTYGAPEIKKNDKYIKDLEDEILTVRAAYSALEGKYVKLEQEHKKLHETIKELRAINEEWAGGKKEDIEVLKAECADLKAQRDRMNNQITNIAKERNDSTSKCRELRREMSEMQRKHEAEVRELNDALMEAKAETNAVKKSKEEALSKYNNAADMLDSDSVAFEAILDLAHIAQSVSQSLYTVSKRIEAETEGRI